ncbi:TPA: phage major capsid protein [Vibrio cholerae]|uniref:phage major capsid protein n=1 Tax=Vibrio cholerae TaxID=666 RepID=UPI00005F45FD|nr:phage major capsid protein [Vibrio cholerae]EMC8696590.1 phage major capsid protein [Vibrio cholerae]KFD96610.1 phage major capsid protein, HK97 family [Vibrio cholerae]KNA58469.1 HK97 family phage major capsid protein [Vibrio cholerae V51]GIB64884.1 Phage major capsid protein, HK97 family [Vibrio cholerae]HCF7740818.1 phage major capsid protein [Vibrio cholerae]
MPAPLEQQVETLQSSLNKIGDAVKAQAEAANKEVARLGEMSAQTRASVDEILTKQGELQARLQEAEQKMLNAGKDNGEEEFRSAGNIVAEKLAAEGVSSNFNGKSRIQMPRSAITSATGSGGGLVAPDRRAGIIAIPERQMTIRDLIAPGTTTSNMVQYVKETGFTNNAAPVAENTSKPYSDITFAMENASVQTIAHLMKASRQILDDASALASFIDARARYGLMIKEEGQLLYGNGTGANLHGIIPQASAYAAPTGAEVNTEQRIDRLRLAILQAALAEYPATGIVLHPTDWATIELLKDNTGKYIIGNPQNGTTPTLWRLPVVSTQSINQNSFLVGAFNLGAQIFDRMDIEVLVSTENTDDFEKNMVTLRAEERLAFAVYRPEAFVTGELKAA